RMGERYQAYQGTSQWWAAASSTTLTPTMTRGPKDRAQGPPARNTPRTRHNRGNAGRTYVGSLLPDRVKNNTHQPPLSNRNPNSGLRRRASSPPPTRKRRNGQARSVPGSSPSNTTGA